MAPRKPKKPSITDIRVLQTWRPEMNTDGLSFIGWELQIQRGTDEWEQLDVENVVLPKIQNEEPSND